MWGGVSGFGVAQGADGVASSYDVIPARHAHAKVLEACQ